jgi:hypothetical protein
MPDIGQKVKRIMQKFIKIISNIGNEVIKIKVTLRTTTSPTCQIDAR